jgi:hypothetical protein
MTTFFCVLLVFGNLFYGPPATKGKSTNAIKVKIVEVLPSGGITVELSNSSKELTRIWRDSNSWGAARWRVLLIRNGRLETFYQNPDQIFTRNIPAFDKIEAGAHVEKKLDLNGGNWCGLGHCASHDQRGFGGEKISFEPNDIIIVIYDVPVTIEAHKLYVWYGVATASTTVR